MIEKAFCANANQAKIDALEEMIFFLTAYFKVSMLSDH